MRIDQSAVTDGLDEFWELLVLDTDVVPIVTGEHEIADCETRSIDIKTEGSQRFNEFTGPSTVINEDHSDPLAFVAVRKDELREFWEAQRGELLACEFKPTGTTHLSDLDPPAIWAQTEMVQFEMH